MSAMREWVREKAELSILVLQKPNIDQILLSRLPDLRLPFIGKSFRPISNGQLHALLHFHLHPIYPVLFRGSLGLLRGYLILGSASRLDAFSVYPFRIWLPCYGIGCQQVHQ